MLSEREHRLRLIRDDITAADRARAEERRQADARQREAEEARRAEEEEARRRAAPTRSTHEVAAAFDDWQRRNLRGGSLATQRF